MQSGADWSDPDWDNETRTYQPDGEEDRASESLRSPAFQQPAQTDLVEESQEATAFGTPVGQVEPQRRLHRRWSDPALEARQLAQDQAAEARDFDTQVRSVNDSDPYQDDAGQWKMRRANASGEVREYGAEAFAKTDPQTGERRVKTSSGADLTIGIDEGVAERRKLLAQRQSLRLQQQMEGAAINDAEAAIAPARQRLKEFGKVPEEHEREIAKLRAGAGSDPSVARRLASREKLYADWKAKNPEYDLTKAELERQQAGIDELKARKRARQWEILSTQIDPTTGQRLSVRPSTFHVERLNTPGDIDGRTLDRIALEGSKGTGLTPMQSTLQALATAKERGMQTVSGRPIDGEIERLNVAIEVAKPKKAFFSVADTFDGIWDAVSGLGVTAPAAFYQLTEGLERPDKYSPKAKAAFAAADKYAKDLEAKTAQRQTQGISTSVGESFREIGPSLGFTAGTIGASIPAAKAGAAIGLIGGPKGAVVGGIVGSLASAGTAAYRMAGASFLNEAFQSLEAESQSKNGRAMTEEEKSAAFEALLPIAKNTALWEAGPEAVGTAVGLGALKIGFGLGKPLASKFAKTLAGRATALAGGAATELGTETLTQVEQAGDQRKLAAYMEGRSMDSEKADWSASGIRQAFKEIAPQTLALMTLMGGAGGAYKGGKKLAERWMPAPAEQVDDAATRLREAQARGATAELANDPVGAAEADESAVNAMREAWEAAQRITAGIAPETRKKLAAIGASDSDFESNEAELASDPSIFFASAEIGRQVRESGLARGDAAQRFAAGQGIDPETAQRVADQHTGLSALREVARFMEGGQLSPERVQALTDLGLIETETDLDGTQRTLVTDDALGLMPAVLKERYAANPDAFPVAATAGATGDIRANLARSGMGRFTSAPSAPAPANASSPTPSQGAGGGGVSQPGGTSAPRTPKEESQALRAEIAAQSPEEHQEWLKDPANAERVRAEQQRMAEAEAESAAGAVSGQPPTEGTPPATQTAGQPRSAPSNQPTSEASPTPGVEARPSDSTDAKSEQPAPEVQGAPDHITVTYSASEDTIAEPDADGNIRLNIRPEDVGKPQAREEWIHAGSLSVLRNEWIARGRPMDFVQFAKIDSFRRVQDLARTLEGLSGSEKEAFGKAIVASWNIYREGYSEAAPKFTTAAEVIAHMLADPKMSRSYSFIHELVRQGIQVRESGEISEQSLSDWIASTVQWLKDALAELKRFAATLTGAEQTQLADLIRETEAELQSWESTAPPVAKSQAASSEAENDSDQDRGDLFARMSSTPDTRVLRASNATVAGPATFRLNARTAYHGTPHKVDRFSLDKIGTGEGAQVYGWGLYFAENEEVAASYQTKLSGPTARSGAAWKEMVSALKEDDNLGFDTVRQAVEEVIGSPTWRTDWEMSPRTIAAIEAYMGSKGNRYAVSLDVEPSELLQWDASIAEQSPEVRKALEQAGLLTQLKREWLSFTNGEGTFEEALESVTGEDVYRMMSGGRLTFQPVEALDGFDEMPRAQKASSALRALGIPGIRYADQGSRLGPMTRTSDGRFFFAGYTERFQSEQQAKEWADRKEGRTYNYVIFDESKIQITHENGQPVSMEESGTLLARRPQSKPTSPTEAGEGPALGARLSAEERRRWTTIQRRLREIEARDGKLNSQQRTMLNRANDALGQAGADVDQTQGKPYEADREDETGQLRARQNEGDRAEPGPSGEDGSAQEAAEDNLRASLEADAGNFEAQERKLVRWAIDNRRFVSSAELGRYPTISSSTAEHEVRHDSATDEVVKINHAGWYGSVPAIIGGELTSVPAEPYQYVERVKLARKVFGDTIRIQGVNVSRRQSMVVGESMPGPGIVTRQKFVRAAVDEKGRALHATDEEIREFFQAEGFEPIPRMTWGWQRKADGIVVMDARSDNFIKTPNGLVPIDLQIAKLSISEGQLRARRSSAPAAPQVSQRDDLDRAMETLPVRMREVINGLMAGKTPEAIAAEMGVSKEAVGKIATAARGRLRQYAEARGKYAPPVLKGDRRKTEYSKSSTQVTFRPEDAAPLVEFANSIPEEDIYTDPDDPTFGRETDPHVTVLYGITSADPGAASRALQDAGLSEATVRLGKTSLFQNDKYDVLKVDIGSPDLHRLNKALRDGTEYENDYPNYKPHATIAYLKPGRGKKYAGDSRLTGRTLRFNEVEFRGKDGKIWGMPLQRATVEKNGALYSRKNSKQGSSVPQDDAAALPSNDPSQASGSQRDERTGLPLNNDGTVTVYHGTTKQGAAEIQKTKLLRSNAEPDVYVTTAKEGTGYGDGTVIPINVRPTDLILDDEFPDGRQDFRIHVGRNKVFRIPSLPDSRAPSSGALYARGSAGPGPVSFPDIDITERTRRHRLPALLFESAMDVLQRQKSQVAQRLAAALQTKADMAAEVEARLATPLEEALSKMTRKETKRAWREVSEYERVKETQGIANANALLPSMSDPGKSLLGAVRKMFATSGSFAVRKGVQVWDGRLNGGAGGYRTIGNKGAEYWPRVLSEDVRKAIEDPDHNPAERQRLEADLAAAGWSPEQIAAFFDVEAPAYLKRDDFFAQLEMARQVSLPPSMYEYDAARIIPQFIRGYSNRMAQIMAYGQKLRRDPNSQDLFDEAIEASVNQKTADFIQGIQKQEYRIGEDSAWAKFTAATRTLATGLLLANPFTTVPRNLISGVLANIEMAGTMRTLRALGAIMRGNVSQMTAKQVGTVKASMMDAMDYDDPNITPQGRIGKFANWTLKHSGYQASEGFVRTMATATGMQWVTDYLNAPPNSKLAQEAEAFMKRVGIDPAAVRAEAGDFKQGPQSRNLLRRFVQESQFGYGTTQVPLWANSPPGRLFYQYGRWGTQRARTLWKHTFEPAIFGEMVDVAGKRYRVRRMKPLATALAASVVPAVKVAGVAILTGEIFAAVAQMLFKRDRDDEDWDVIVEELSKDEKDAAKHLGQRLLNDILMGGMLGILSQPVDMVKSWISGSRFKNPIEPPATAIPKATYELLRSMYERGAPANVEDAVAGHGKDLWTAVRTTLPGVSGGADVSGRIGALVSDEIDYFESQENSRAVMNLKKATRRYAAQTGLEVGSPLEGRMAKRPQSATYDRLQTELMLGNEDKAQRIVDEYLERFGSADPDKALRSLAASVRARQPLKVGSHSSDEVQQSFLDWATKHVSPERLAEFERVQETYESTARALGLMK